MLGPTPEDLRDRTATGTSEAGFEFLLGKGRAPGEQVHALQRLRLADAEPLAIETTYLPVTLTPGLLQQSLDGSLWTLLRDDYAIVPGTAQATLQFIVIDDASASLLRLRSAAPGILQTRKTYDQGGRCIEFARDIYRADRAAFEFDAIVQPPSPPQPRRSQRVAEQRQSRLAPGQRCSAPP